MRGSIPTGLHIRSKLWTKYWNLSNLNDWVIATVPGTGTGTVLRIRTLFIFWRRIWKQIRIRIRPYSEQGTSIFLQNLFLFYYLLKVYFKILKLL